MTGGLKKSLSCCYLPANSVENKSEDLQVSTEAEMDTGEVGLSDPKSVTEADKVTEAVKVVETPTKGIDNPASLLGNSDTMMLVLGCFASCKFHKFDIVVS